MPSTLGRSTVCFHVFPTWFPAVEEMKRDKKRRSMRSSKEWFIGSGHHLVDGSGSIRKAITPVMALV